MGVGTKGDTVKAAAILATAKIKTPVTIRIAYRSSDSSDKALAALLPGWQAAGFEPELVPISEDYFTAISAPEMAKKVDVCWSNWAPAWASASTILPPLFESTINVTAEGPGRDYGYWADPETNAAIAKVGAISDRAAREKAWGDLDVSLLRQGAYIGLADRRAMYVAGSDIRNFSANEILGGVVEFADIAVAG